MSIFLRFSLNKNSNEYELKRLNEISVEGNAFFGIPFKAKKKKGVVVRFNGIDLGRSNQLLPILTMLGYTAVMGTAINEIVGTKDSGKYKLGMPLSSVIGLPIAGILNNLTWSGAALQNASWNLNSRLVEENKDVDVFLNPKYVSKIKKMEKEEKRSKFFLIRKIKDLLN
jgi:hypothetical protein